MLVTLSNKDIILIISGAGLLQWSLATMRNLPSGEDKNFEVWVQKIERFFYASGVLNNLKFML